MAETRKTKELNLFDEKPELLNKKSTSEKEPNLDHEVYNKQSSDPKKDQNKFLKKWHNSKKFRIGIIVGIVCLLGLSLGLGLGFGLKGEGGIFDFDDDGGKTPLAEDKGDKNHIKSDFEIWIANMSNTPENDIRDLENAAILWSLDKEVSLGLINPSDASAAKDKAEKKADKEIDNEKKEQKKADEEWDNYLTGLGFDSEEAYYNSKIANSLLATSNVVDGLVDFDDTTNKVTKQEIEDKEKEGNEYKYVSSAPKNSGSSEGDYLAITSDSFLETSPNTTETLMELYLNIAKPVAFQQESISYTLNSSGNPGTNPNEWESMTFADNTQVQAAYVMAWKLDNAASSVDSDTYHYYDSAKSDTPIVPSTKSGVKHFNSLPTDLTSLAYYYAVAGNTENVDEIIMNDSNTGGLTFLGDKANQVLLDQNIITSLPGENEIVDDGTFDDTNITETDRRNISNEVFNGNGIKDSQVKNGLSNNSLYSNGNGNGNKKGNRVLGKTITWNSKDKDSNDANIENKYLLTTDAAGFTLTRMENPNYLRVDESNSTIDTSYDLYTVGENMLENDLEKELNTPEKSSYMGIPKYGIWEDFELWVNDNAKTLALNWALSSEDSDFLTNEDYHIDLMDDLINEEITTQEGKTLREKNVSNKGQELINYFYSELIVNQENLFLDKQTAAYDFMVKDDNNDIYLSFAESATVRTIFDQFTIFNTKLQKNNGNYSIINFEDFLPKNEEGDL